MSRCNRRAGYQEQRIILGIFSPSPRMRAFWVFTTKTIIIQACMHRMRICEEMGEN
jgi:hypothetical protein